MKRLLYLVLLCPSLLWADAKVSQLIETTTPKTTDFMYIVANSTGMKVTPGSILALSGNGTTYLTIQIAATTYIQISTGTNGVGQLLRLDTNGLITNSLIDTSSVTKGGVLTAGANITLTPGAGITTISATSGGGGSSSLAVSTNGVIVSSPTSRINFMPPFQGTLDGSTTSQINLDVSSVTLQGQSVLSFSSATATYLQNSSATATYLQLSSAAVTYFAQTSSSTLLTTSSATATYLQLSSAIATYFPIVSSTTLLTTSSATATYLQLSSAAVTYFAATSSGTLLTTSSATATYLQLSSAAVTYPVLVGGLVQNSRIDGSSITKQGLLVAGSNVTLTPGVGTLTIASSGSGGGASVYPATATARFDFGLSASTVNFSTVTTNANMGYSTTTMRVELSTHMFVNGVIQSSGNASGYSTVDRGLTINAGGYNVAGTSASFRVRGSPTSYILEVQPSASSVTINSLMFTSIVSTFAVVSSTFQISGVFRSTSTTGMGISVKTGANTACNTTCGGGCFGGFDTGTLGVSLAHIVICSDATADECYCFRP